MWWPQLFGECCKGLVQIWGLYPEQFTDKLWISTTYKFVACYFTSMIKIIEYNAPSLYQLRFVSIIFFHLRVFDKDFIRIFFFCSAYIDTFPILWFITLSIFPWPSFAYNLLSSFWFSNMSLFDSSTSPFSYQTTKASPSHKCQFLCDEHRQGFQKELAEHTAVHVEMSIRCFVWVLKLYCAFHVGCVFASCCLNLELSETKREPSWNFTLTLEKCQKEAYLRQTTALFTLLTCFNHELGVIWFTPVDNNCENLIIFINLAFVLFYEQWCSWETRF